MSSSSGPQPALGGPPRPSARLRSLYICYLSLADPLAETQVLAYLEGLARSGYDMHLLTFEPKRWSRAERNAMRDNLRARGVAWHTLPYHKTPSLPATVLDALLGAAFVAFAVRRYKIDVLHARMHVPAAMVLLLRPFMRLRFVFDIRGLMAEENVDAGRWTKGGWPWRITKAIERRACAVADRAVVLTPEARRYLFPDSSFSRVYVIPCCADISRIRAKASESSAWRTELALGCRPVMLYVGKLSNRYRGPEMVEFFTAVQRQIEGLHFLVVTQASAGEFQNLFRSSGIPDSDYTITSVPAVAIGGVLAAADFGVCFIAPRLSELAASPTKIGEYLAAGLPVVTTVPSGPSAAAIRDARAGIVLDELTPAAQDRAASEIADLVQDSATRTRALAVADREFSLDDLGIPSYVQLYDSLLVPKAQASDGGAQLGARE